MPHFPVFENDQKDPSIVVYGRQDRLFDKDSKIMARIEQLKGNPEKTCLVLPAEGIGVYLSQVANYQTPIKAGGVKLTEVGSVAIIQSQDAPIVILRDESTGNIVVCRAGRDALLPKKSDCALCDPPGIIENSVHLLVGHTTRQNIKAQVVAGICGTCFKHERKGAQELVAPFDQFGKDVFVNRKLGTLNLFKVISLQLSALGVPVENISKANHCTFEHRSLASNRLRHRQVNTVVVVRRP